MIFKSLLKSVSFKLKLNYLFVHTILANEGDSNVKTVQLHPQVYFTIIIGISNVGQQK